MNNSIVQTQLLKIIENNKLSHTYMFEGDAIETLRKYSMFFALNILGHSTRNEMLLESGNHPDLYHLSTDENTIKKEDIEQLVRRMNQKPVESDYKVYIIEQFEKLTPQAENSILKFLEEPPEKTIAILLTINKSGILPTIHSRSQHIQIAGEDGDRAASLSNLSEAETATVNALALNAHYVNEMADKFSEMRREVMTFSARWIHNHPLVLIDAKKLVDVCDDRKDYELVLQLLSGFIRQVLHKTIGLDDFQPYETVMPEGNDVNAVKLTRMLEEIQKANRFLSFNVNPMLVFEGMVIGAKG
ncbi:MAG TPA: hypothetical protein K8V97_01145 [Jeotgalicoccus aerolatus]|nr:hypothetical protein [Jeotgalicoccus aerolatus]HJG32312.1 hypothetical protein [Jeotgalicoccus aerolatus]